MKILPCLPMFALLLAACQAPAPAEMEPRPRFELVRAGDLAVAMEIDRDVLHSGQTVELTIRAMPDRNVRQPVEIVAPTGARAYIEVQRHTGLGWETVRRYPEAATTVITRWQLEPGQVWQQTYTLPVEPDWPTHQPVRLVGYLNGRPEVAPTLDVNIRPRQ